MTATQQALTSGFNASLAKRGVVLFLQPGGQQITALLEATAPQNEKYPVNQATRTATKIHVLKTAIAALPKSVSIGSNFKSSDGTKNYRVVSIADDPIAVKVVYACETSDVPV